MLGGLSGAVPADVTSASRAALTWAVSVGLWSGLFDVVSAEQWAGLTLTCAVFVGPV
jgi:hypothetical protein